MKKVLLRAPVFSRSGYGVHSRQIAKYLLERSDVELFIAPVQWGGTSWYLNENDLDGLIGKMMSCSRPMNCQADLSVQVQLPHEWDSKLALKNIGVTAGVETDICSPNWLNAISKMDHVIVPSEFTKSVFEKTLNLIQSKPDEFKNVLEKVSVVHESYPDAIDNCVDSFDFNFDTEFNFLLVGQLTARSSDIDRKNIFNSIKWFCETFKDDPTVGLIIKTNSGRETKIDRQVTREILEQLVNSVRKSEFPKIHFIHGTLTDGEMAKLYKHPSIKAFFTCTRGEGFGLPILEAAASEIPVIATNWSGHLDFLKEGKFIKLDFELTQIPKSRVLNEIFIEGSKWAEVHENDVKKKLLKFKNRPEIPTEWAYELAKKLKMKFSSKAIQTKYDNIFAEFLK